MIMMIENDDDTKRQRYNNMRDITHDKTNNRYSCNGSDNGDDDGDDGGDDCVKVQQYDYHHNRWTGEQGTSTRSMCWKHKQATGNHQVKAQQRLELTVACSVLLCNPPLCTLGESRC